MNKSHNLLKIISLGLVLALASEQGAWAAPELAPALRPAAPLSAAVLAEKPWLLEVPAAEASLEEFHRGTNGRLIVHVQDPHSNFDGQENLARTLGALSEKYPLSLVLSEGGVGDSSLLDLRDELPRKTWQRVARRWLREARIAGEEYWNLTSDRPLPIAGIENRERYFESVRAYADLAKRREASLDYLRRVRRAIQDLKPRMYPRELVEYERAAADADKTDKRIEILSAWVESAKLEAEAPAFRKMLELRRAEKADSAAVAALEWGSIVAEMDALERKMYTSKLADRPARVLRSIDRYTRLLEDAFSVRMTSAEFAEFETNEKNFATFASLAFLNRRLGEHDLAESLVPYDSILEDGKKDLRRFYASVDARDEAFFKNTEKAMAEKGQSAAFLVAGGYHTEHLKKLFSDKGYSFAVIRPAVTNETNWARYEERLLAPVTKLAAAGPAAKPEIKIDRTSDTARAALLQLMLTNPAYASEAAAFRAEIAVERAAIPAAARATRDLAPTGVSSGGRLAEADPEALLRLIEDRKAARNDRWGALSDLSKWVKQDPYERSVYMSRLQDVAEKIGRSSNPGNAFIRNKIRAVVKSFEEELHGSTPAAYLWMTDGPQELQIVDAILAADQETLLRWFTESWAAAHPDKNVRELGNRRAAALVHANKEEIRKRRLNALFEISEQKNISVERFELFVDYVAGLKDKETGARLSFDADASGGLAQDAPLVPGFIEALTVERMDHSAALPQELIEQGLVKPSKPLKSIEFTSENILTPDGKPFVIFSRPFVSETGLYYMLALPGHYRNAAVLKTGNKSYPFGLGVETTSGYTALFYYDKLGRRSINRIIVLDNVRLVGLNRLPRIRPRVTQMSDANSAARLAAGASPRLEVLAQIRLIREQIAGLNAAETILDSKIDNAPKAENLQEQMKQLLSELDGKKGVLAILTASLTTDERRILEGGPDAAVPPGPRQLSLFGDGARLANVNDKPWEANLLEALDRAGKNLPFKVNPNKDSRGNWRDLRTSTDVIQALRLTAHQYITGETDKVHAAAMNLPLGPLRTKMFTGASTASMKAEAVIRAEIPERIDVVLADPAALGVFDGHIEKLKSILDAFAAEIAEAKKPGARLATAPAGSFDAERGAFAEKMIALLGSEIEDEDVRQLRSRGDYVAVAVSENSYLNHHGVGGIPVGPDPYHEKEFSSTMRKVLRALKSGNDMEALYPDMAKAVARFYYENHFLPLSQGLSSNVDFDMAVEAETLDGNSGPALIVGAGSRGLYWLTRSALKDARLQGRKIYLLDQNKFLIAVYEEYRRLTGDTNSQIIEADAVDPALPQLIPEKMETVLVTRAIHEFGRTEAGFDESRDNFEKYKSWASARGDRKIFYLSLSQILAASGSAFILEYYEVQSLFQEIQKESSLAITNAEIGDDDGSDYLWIKVRPASARLAAPASAVEAEPSQNDVVFKKLVERFGSIEALKGKKGLVLGPGSDFKLANDLISLGVDVDAIGRDRDDSFPGYYRPVEDYNQWFEQLPPESLDFVIAEHSLYFDRYSIDPAANRQTPDNFSRDEKIEYRYGPIAERLKAGGVLITTHLPYEFKHVPSPKELADAGPLTLSSETAEEGSIVRVIEKKSGLIFDTAYTPPSGYDFDVQSAQAIQRDSVLTIVRAYVENEEAFEEAFIPFEADGKNVAVRIKKAGDGAAMTFHVLENGVMTRIGRIQLSVDYLREAKRINSQNRASQQPQPIDQARVVIAAYGRSQALLRLADKALVEGDPVVVNVVVDRLAVGEPAYEAIRLQIHDARKSLEKRGEKNVFVQIVLPDGQVLDRQDLPETYKTMFVAAPDAGLLDRAEKLDAGFLSVEAPHPAEGEFAFVPYAAAIFAAAAVARAKTVAAGDPLDAALSRLIPLQFESDRLGNFRALLEVKNADLALYSRLMIPAIERFRIEEVLEVLRGARLAVGSSA